MKPISSYSSLVGHITHHFYLKIAFGKVKSILLANAQKEKWVHLGARPIDALKVINNPIKYILRYLDDTAGRPSEITLICVSPSKEPGA